MHRPRIAALLDAGPDLLAIETIPSIVEVAALVELLAEFPGAEAWMTFCCRDGERLSDGTPIEAAVALAAGSGRLAAVGVNCTPPEHIGRCSRAPRACTELPLLAYPNHGRTWDADGVRVARAGRRRLPARGRRRVARARRARHRRLLRDRTRRDRGRRGGAARLRQP